MKTLRIGTSAVLAAAGLLLAAQAAQAVEAVATSAVNVRTGPGTGFGIVDQLTAGEVVDITECAPSGWCFVEHTGPDGWVSATFLAPADEVEEEEEVAPEGPDCGFGFTLGPGGPSLSINCGDAPVPPGPPAPPPPAPSEDDEACFYVGANFTGASVCYGPSTRNSLNATFNDRISSVELYGDAKARLCVNTNLGGYCREITSDMPNLPVNINDRASSLRVYVGPVIAPIPLPPVIVLPITPVTYSTGPIALQQTFMANLDNGAITGGPQADIWYHAVTAVNKFFEPRNGAAISFAGGAQRGYAGCSTAAYSNAPVSIWAVPVGSYVCVRTNQGRYSEFRLNGYSGTTMNLGYTTWE